MKEQADSTAIIPLRIRDNRKAGWFWISNEILDVYGPKLGIYAFAVYAVLCRHANNSNGKCCPSIRRMAVMTASSIATVKRSISRLQEIGLISVSREGAGPYANNIYTLLTVPSGLSGNDGLLPRCWYCGIELDEVINEHQNPVSRFKDSDQVSSCGACNSLKSNKTVDEFRTLFPTGHRFYGEKIGSIGTYLDGDMGSNGTHNVPLGSQIGSNRATNKTITNKTQQQDNTGTPYFFELTPPNPEYLKRETQKEKQAKENLPDWLPMEQWLGYVDMRKKSKHPLTEYAQRLELKELTKLRIQGHDPVAVLEQSIKKTYRGLFAPNGSNGNGHQPPEDALERERRKDAERRTKSNVRL